MENLFSEFKPSSAGEWKAQLLKDLKGEALESLNWKNENGFDIAPFYTREDIQGTCEPAFVHSDWEICVKAKHDTAALVNKQLLRDLARGATAIDLDHSLKDMPEILKDVQLQHINCSFSATTGDLPSLLSLLEKGNSQADISCSFFPSGMQNLDDLQLWIETFVPHHNKMGFRFVAADILPAHNQGALAYYEIALCFSVLNEHLAFFSENGNFPDSDFVVKTGVNSDFFIQMAKLRAIRRLWEIFKSEYKISNNLHLIVETGLDNKSLSDTHNNLLRTTVESMAAVAGGCNELIVNRFDAFVPEPADLAERMAINQQLILKEESAFNKMADMACGSYYIESLTDQLATRAFETFKGFERQGGYFACLKKGIFHQDISAQSAQRKKMIASGEMPVIGVNKYSNNSRTSKLNEEALKEIGTMKNTGSVLEFELQTLKVK